MGIHFICRRIPLYMIYGNNINKQPHFIVGLFVTFIRNIKLQIIYCLSSRTSPRGTEVSDLLQCY